MPNYDDPILEPRTPDVYDPYLRPDGSDWSDLSDSPVTPSGIPLGE